MATIPTLEREIDAPRLVDEVNAPRMVSLDPCENCGSPNVFSTHRRRRILGAPVYRLNVIHALTKEVATRSNEPEQRRSPV
jgi:hypothetical protein